VDPATGAAPIRLSVPGGFAVGTPVQVEIVVEERPDVLIVPAAAIVREEGAAAVLVVGADGKAHRRAVEVGLTSADEVQIVSGLRAGEKVVVKGQDELPDGAAVEVEEAAAAEP